MSQPFDAAEYLADALDIIRLHAYHADRIDWSAAKTDAGQLATSASVPADVYPFLQSLITRLGDHHSFLLDPESARRVHAGEHEEREIPEGPVLLVPDLPIGGTINGTMGYLELPGVIGDGDAVVPFMQVAHAILADGRAQGVDRWVVDLRRNTGGNFGPLLVAAGPLLGTSTPGAFVPRAGDPALWRYSDGGGAVESWTLAALSSPCADLDPALPVAVLTSSYTRSAGELTAVAFNARPACRRFGQPTAGVPTTTECLRLSDGTELFLTTAISADRTGQTFAAPLIPDETTTIDWDTFPADTTLQIAAAWLLAQ